MTELTAADDRGEFDGNLALLGYCLLLGSILFAGLPGMVAVILAYVQREVAGPIARVHFNFQIQIFWVALGLTVIAALSALAALVLGVGQLVESLNGHSDAWDAMAFGGPEFHLRPSIIASMVVAGVSLAAAGLWVIVTPIIGLIRLASDRRMGDRAA